MTDLKAMAIYLPQYHRVKENDEWWGEGFTEWTAVKQAERYYDGHYQPRIPLNENYYDLSDKKTLEWQAKLARQYGIFGFCFYHYYFKNGKKILEKPAENLLIWNDIPLNYCFSWANMPWQRTWSNFTLGGSWASKFEKYREDENPILLQQDYGDEKAWKAHFDYLLPFFKDIRYVKIEGKPVFMFHVVEDIACISEMVSFWRIWAEENGFPGLYLIGAVRNGYQEYPMLDALYVQEPAALMTDYILYSDDSKKDICTRYNNYEDACRWSVLKRYQQNSRVFYSAFPGYDTTPRHGKRGIIFDSATPEKFEKSFREVCRKSVQSNNELVFINAWNEWGEGNYLEPDTKYGYGFLEAVQKVLTELGDKTFVNQFEKSDMDVFYQVIEKKEKENNKYRSYVNLFNQWMTALEEEKDISLFFSKHNYNEIAIYGMGILGKHLYRQLKQKVDIVYFIDRKVEIKKYQIPIYNPDEILPTVDVVVVTVIDEYEEISEVLKEKTNAEIVSLAEVIKENV